MDIPIPFPAQPGDRLTVTQDNPCGTDLQTGDIVTVQDVSIHIASGVPVPVLQVATGYGVLLLTFDVVSPTTAEAVTITAAEPDELVNEFFFRILGNDDDLRAWAVTARDELAKNDPAPVITDDDPDLGGGTALAERPRNARQVGESFTFEDPQGDELEVVYYEQDCPNHGREGGFHFSINDEEEVIVPAHLVDPLIKFLFTRRKHSERPESE